MSIKTVQAALALVAALVIQLNVALGQSPVAIIESAEQLSDTAVCVGNSLTFTSASTELEEGATFSWTFGDGADPASAAGPGPHNVVYATSGVQNVTLTVDNNNGSSSSSAGLNFMVFDVPEASLDLISLGWNYEAYEDNGDSFFVHCNSFDAANFLFEISSEYMLEHTIDWGDGSPAWMGSGSALIEDHDYELGAFTLTHFYTDPVTGCSDSHQYSVFNGTAPNISFQSSGTYSCLGDVFEVYLGSQGGLTDYELLFSDSTLYTFTTAADTTIQHAFSANSCGFETNSYANAYMLELVATNGCSFEISTDIEFDPVFVSSAPDAQLESTACPGCSGASFQLSDASVDAVYASPSGCLDTLHRFWVIDSDLDYTLDAGALGSSNGYVQDNYVFGGWSSGSSSIDLTVNEPGVFSAWLYTGNVCGYDSVFYSCEILPAGDIEVASSSFENGVLEICDGDSVEPFDLISSLPGDTIYWTIDVPDAVGGIDVVSGFGISPLTLPGWVLTNNSISTQTVVVEVSLLCDTGTEVLTIDVLPTIQVYLGPPSPQDTVCSGTVLFELVNTTVHDVYVEWEVDSMSLVEGGTSGSGPVITDQLFNTTDSVQSLDYVFTTPFAQCPAEPFTHTFEVVPEYALPAPLDSIIACPDEEVVLPDYEVSLDGMDYSWYVAGDDVGLPASGSGYLSQFTTENNSNQPANATLVVQSDLWGCTDESSIPILVHPQPQLTVASANEIVCSSAAANLTVESTVQPVELNWTYTSNGAVAGGESGSDPAPVSVVDVLINESPALDSVHWTFTTPNYVCPADPLEVVVLVAPALEFMSMDSIQVCNGEAVVVQDADLGIDGVSYSWVSSEGPGIGLAVTGDSLLSGWLASQSSNSMTAEADVMLIGAIYGCADTVAFHVAVEPIPEVVISNWANQLCSSGQLESLVSSTITSGQVQWNPAAGDQISGAMSGQGNAINDVLVNEGTSPDSVVYSLWVDDTFCVSDTVSMTVEVLPSFALEPLEPIEWCNGDEAIIEGYETAAEGVVYHWTNSNEAIGLGDEGQGTIPSWTATNTTDEAIASGIVVFANLANCPEESISIDVFVHPTPQLSFNVGPNGGLDCQTGTAFIEAFASTGNGDYSFDGTYVINAEGSLAEVGAAGEYQIEFVDAVTGCEAALDVLVNEPVPAVILGQSLDSLACFGQDDASITIDAGGGDDLLYDWSPPVSTTAMASNLGPGTYQVVVTNASNCQDSASYTLDDVLPIEVELVESGASICGASNGFIEVEATGGYGELTFNWSDASGSLLWGVPAGSYPVTVSDAYGCEVDTTFSIVCADDIPIGFNQLITPNGDGKNDTWILEGLYLYPDHSVKVFNRWGVVVFQAAPYLNDWNGTWNAEGGDGSPLPSATYYYLFEPGLESATPSRGFIEIQNEGR